MHLRKTMLSTMEINNLRERHSHSAHCQVFEPVDMLHIIGHDPLKPGEHDQYIVTGMISRNSNVFSLTKTCRFWLWSTGFLAHQSPYTLQCAGDSGQGMTGSTIGGILIKDMILGVENPWAEVYAPSRCLPLSKSTMCSLISQTAHTVQVSPCPDL